MSVCGTSNSEKGIKNGIVRVPQVRPPSGARTLLPLPSLLNMQLARTLVCVYFVAAPMVSAQVNVVTQHNDIGRTGQNLNETILTPATLTSGNFGKLFSVTVDGQVYAQPLYISNLSINAGTHNVVFVATEHDSVYAFDADSGGSPLWQITLLDAAHGATAGATTDPETDTNCNEISGPEYGITGTPVIDPVAGILYVVGKTFENGYPVQRLHALSITTGAETGNSPVTLAGKVAGTGSGSSNGVLAFDPKWENQRPGLLLLNGIVYMAFASHCDYGPFHGWIMAYNASTLQQTSVFVTTPNGVASGIWMSGAGLAADVPAGSPFGRMFVATGNGTYDATTPYGTNNMDYGDDVVRLDLTNGVMTVTDAFTPYNQAALSTGDLDMAAGGVMLLPDQTLAGHTHQMLAAGKTGTIYVLDRDNLGGYNNGGTTDNTLESIINQIAGVFSTPAYWNENVYYWSIDDWMAQFSFTNGLMNTWYAPNHTTETQTFPGATPSISANGTTNAIVWAIDASAFGSSGNAILQAHEATAVGTTLYSSANNSADNPGVANKYTVPTIANGKVYVGTYGQLSVYGLKTADFNLTAAATSLTLTQGSSTSDTITVGTIGGFTGNVTLAASGLPSGVTASFAAGSSTGSIVATFTATSTAVIGPSTITLTGTSGTLTNSISLSLTVTSSSATPQPQTITFNQIAPQVVGTSLTLTASASSGLPVTYTPVPNGNCSISGNVVTFLQIGNCGVVASQPGNSSYAAATPIGVIIAVINKSSQTITFAAIPTEAVGGSISLSASSSSGLPITFTSNTTSVCTVSGSTASLFASGTCTIVASQAGNQTYSAATPVAQSFTVGTAANFTFSFSSSSITIPRNFFFYSAESDTATVSGVNGFPGTVTFAVSGLPPGLTASFSPTSISRSGTSRLTLNPSFNLAPGTYTITVSAVSGLISHAVKLTVVVQ